ncbi:hypothetical protein [Actinoplanes sp. N902-109]|uniref:hypothetical protein n=1 Tax=Actinoplanes sp. (strain N902-109) TaxID=649831 RepID=UPI00032935B0|nr:hypothetical protein [Actinoplanes sp. N902-109]AGL13836.1 hypothetical protein L083_0326 [Actinoplanes sp. N902-109]
MLDGDDVTHPPAPPAAPLPIPHQRLPVELHDLPPLTLVPGSTALPLPPYPRKRRRGLVLGGILALVAALALAGGAIFVANRESLPAIAEAAAPNRTRPLTPFEAATAALQAQADALLKNNEKAWLAAVDPGQPKLRTRYRSMFRSLRTLGVSAFEYKPVKDGSDTATSVEFNARMIYCLTGNACPAGPAARPVINQHLKVKNVRGQWVIASATTRKSEDDLQPAPWQDGDLAVAKGKRVTLVAQASEKKYFKRLLPIADAAAAVNDRFAGLVGNPQQRYRVYLAGNKQWKLWYGGMTDDWVVGYAAPLNEAGMDVVLHMNDLKNEPRLLQTTIQHELGHVVTLGGAHRKDWGPSDMWLKEGVAEYIGWYPQSATASWRRESVRDLLTGSKAPKSIAVGALQSDARLEEGDAFYGLGHFAADCMAKNYGQRALFTFVRLYLREEKDLDPASREAFGQPFKTVDRDCLAWIRDRV